MNRKFRVLQIAVGDMIVDQFPDPIMRDQEIAAPQKSQQGAPADRENVMPGQSAPDGFQLQHPLQGGIPRIISTVQRADAGADHHIRRYAMGGERVHHAHLNGAKAAAAREDKGGPGGCSIGYGYVQSPGRSSDPRAGEWPCEMLPQL